MSEERKKQVGGDHYSKLGVQPFDIFKSMGIFEQVCQANIIKYVMRYQGKGGVEDLEKAAHYLEELIKVKEQVNDNITDIAKNSVADHAWLRQSCKDCKEFRRRCVACRFASGMSE